MGQKGSMNVPAERCRLIRDIIYSAYDLTDWSKILFTDESTFCVQPSKT